MPLKPIASRLGKGPSYPFRFNSVGAVQLSSEEEQVKDCIRRLLRTSPGEDPFAFKNGIPYGVRTSEVLFNNLDAARDILIFETRLALDTWEPRIQVLGISFSVEERPRGLGSAITSIISFRFRSTGRTDTLVSQY